MMLETQSITVEREQAYTCSIGERLASLFWLKTLGSICAISSFFAELIGICFLAATAAGVRVQPASHKATPVKRERGDLN